MVVKRVMVIDDDPELLELVAYILSQEGYEVVTACNGLEALDRLREVTPDFIFVDLRMPYLGGFEFCLEIRE